MIVYMATTILFPVKEENPPLLLDLLLGLLLMNRLLTDGRMSLFVHLLDLQESDGCITTEQIER